MDETSAGEPSREWYAEGLRFECTQCGNCCTGPPGFVWFDEAEGRALAGELGLQVEAFYAKYARREGSHWSLIEHETEHGYDCIFLDRTSQPGKAICSVYHARPAQCKSWPFWSENLRTRATWRQVKRVTPCPGMGQGAIVPIEQIRIQRDQHTG